MHLQAFYTLYVSVYPLVARLHGVTQLCEPSLADLTDNVDEYHGLWCEHGHSLHIFKSFQVQVAGQELTVWAALAQRPLIHQKHTLERTMSIWQLLYCPSWQMVFHHVNTSCICTHATVTVDWRISGLLIDLFIGSLWIWFSVGSGIWESCIMCVDFSTDDMTELKRWSFIVLLK